MSETEFHYVKCKKCGNYKAITADNVAKLNLSGGKKNFVCYGCIEEEKRRTYGFRDFK